MTRGHVRALACALSVVLLSAVLGGCSLLNRPSRQPTAEEIKETVLGRANSAVQLLKAKDMTGLAAMVHPDKGVRFSPYGHILVDSDRHYSAADLKGLLADKTVYNWGAYDGSGDPIDLTFEKYYGKFVYDVDFVAAPNVGYNQVLGMGNTLINTGEVYPDALFVEYYFAGFDPQYGGMDWRSLRLVFENKGGVWYLVGIVHDQWTI